MLNLTTILAQSFWLPKNAATAATSNDEIFNIILYVTTFFFLFVVGLMLFFVIKYHRKKGVGTLTTVTHNTPLEIAWTVIPLIILMVFFVLGFQRYIDFDQPPSNAMVVDVTAKQWSFLFSYPNGAQSESLYVPLNQNVVLTMHSDDVTHALYIPVFRIQRNIIPQRTTLMWFKPTVASPPEGYTLFCTQYCGQGHSNMGSGNRSGTPSFVHVLPQAQWDAKMAELSNLFYDKDKKPVPYREVGARLYQMNGCSSCHTVDGGKGQGPTWKGLYKSDVPGITNTGAAFLIHKTDSDEIWDAYLKESILDPGAKIVQGFQNVMPPNFAAQFAGSPGNEKKLTAMLEYIKSLGPNYDPSGDPGLAAAATQSAPAASPAAK